MPIYKYQLASTFNDFQQVSLPRGAVPIHVGMQENKFYVWAEVVRTTPWQAVNFWIAWTGHLRPPSMYRHLGTIQSAVGEVHHVYWMPL